MSTKAAIAVNRPREEVQRLWNGPDHRPGYIAACHAAVTFTDAPGGRGTGSRSRSRERRRAAGSARRCRSSPAAERVIAIDQYA